MTNLERLLDVVARNLRSSFRTWAKAPAFALGTVATLGASIAALAAVFVLVNAVLLNELPYRDPDRLVVLLNSSRGQPSGSPFMSAPRARTWLELTKSVEQVAFYSHGPAVTLRVDGEPRAVSAAHVSASFFSVFGARAARGRVFSPDEDVPGAARVVVVSHVFWQRQLASNEAAIGQTIAINGEPTVILGVLDAGFDARSLAPAVGDEPDVWLPIRLDPATNDDAHTLLVVARLRPDTGMEVARLEAASAAEVFRSAFPGELASDGSFDVVSLARVVSGEVRPSLLMLLAATGLLTALIAANVTNLFLARATERRRELAVRIALGASRVQLAIEALVESLALGMVSAVVGTLAGVALIRSLLQSGTIRLPRLGAAGMADLIDTRVLILVSTSAAAVALILALVPAAAAAKAGALERELRSGTRATSRQRRALSLLLGVEIALACVLVVGAALLLRSLTSLQRVAPGFERRDVMTMQTPSGDRRMESAVAAVQIFDEGLRELAAVPGVEAAAVTLTGAPLEQGGALRIDVVGRSSDRLYLASWDLVSPDYFDVFKVPLIDGRRFDERDRLATPLVAVVNETMARQLWPNERAVGQRILIGQGGGPAFDERAAREVIGVVSDVRQVGLAFPPRPGVYVPLAQMPEAQMAFINRLSAPATWAVRTRPAMIAGADRLERELRRVTALPVARVRSMDDVFSDSTARVAQNTLLMGGFGILALLVAGLGVFALASYSVQQRSHELAVRVALGAQAGHLRRMVVADSIRVASWGIGAGLVAAAMLATLMTRFLFGVQAHDPAAFSIVPAVLTVATIAAAYLPARRASKADPVAKLRE